MIPYDGWLDSTGRRINKPNLMIKIPATKEGVPAIQRMIAEGRNVNVTVRLRSHTEASHLDLPALSVPCLSRPDVKAARRDRMMSTPLGD